VRAAIECLGDFSAWNSSEVEVFPRASGREGERRQARRLATAFAQEGEKEEGKRKASVVKERFILI